MSIIRLAIIGGRDFNDYEYMKECLDRLTRTENVLQVVSGGARGADSLGERWAIEKGIPTNIILPDWDRYGRSAGFRRNQTIIDSCDVVAAFWDGKSKGTADSIGKAKAANKKVHIFRY